VRGVEAERGRRHWVHVAPPVRAQRPRLTLPSGRRSPPCRRTPAGRIGRRRSSTQHQGYRNPRRSRCSCRTGDARTTRAGGWVIGRCIRSRPVRRGDTALRRGRGRGWGTRPARRWDRRRTRRSRKTRRARRRRCRSANNFWHTSPLSTNATSLLGDEIARYMEVLRRKARGTRRWAGGRPQRPREAAGVVGETDRAGEDVTTRPRARPHQSTRPLQG
jgi:hypothetical protein